MKQKLLIYSLLFLLLILLFVIYYFHITKHRVADQNTSLGNRISEINQRNLQLNENIISTNMHLVKIEDALSEGIKETVNRGNLSDKILKYLLPINVAKRSKNIASTIALVRNLNCSDKLEEFSTYFNGMHPNLLHKLKEKHPNLSNKEIRHCTFLSIGVPSKKVAALMGVSDNSVEVARYRIKKKMQIPKEQSLSLYLKGLGENILQ